jgi:probable phosphoglycerate mutase
VLILVRHGRTPANAQGLLQGRLDQHLDERGRRQAVAVAEHVHRSCDVDEVVSSPLLRAAETAEAFGATVELDDRWIELAYGEFEGQPHRDVPSEVWRSWKLDPTYTPVGGESLAALDERVREACGDIAARAATSNVVVVSHVSPIKSAVAWALDVGIEISWSCHLDHAAICRVVFRDGRPLLLTFNETVPVEE